MIKYKLLIGLIVGCLVIPNNIFAGEENPGKWEQVFKGAVANIWFYMYGYPTRIPVFGFEYAGIEFPPGTWRTVLGDRVEIQVSTPVEINGYKFPRSTTLVFFHDKLQFASIYYDKEFMGQLLPAQTMILFTPSGKIDYIILAGDALINGVLFKANDQIIFNEENKRFEKRTEALREPDKTLQRTRNTSPRS